MQVSGSESEAAGATGEDVPMAVLDSSSSSSSAARKSGFSGDIESGAVAGHDHDDHDDEISGLDDDETA
jgi:hypothetical protein